MTLEEEIALIKQRLDKLEFHVEHGFERMPMSLEEEDDEEKARDQTQTETAADKGPDPDDEAV